MPRTKQFNEEEILNKAMELFWEKGFHATSIQDLVSHLGINRASLYGTFGGKEELFKKAFQRYRTMSSCSLSGIFETETSVKKGFRMLFFKAIAAVQTNPEHKGCFVVNTTTELLPGDDAIKKALMENKAHVEHLFISYIKSGMRSGEISADKNAESIGMMLFALYSGLEVLAKVEHDVEKLHSLVEVGLSVLD